MRFTISITRRAGAGGDHNPGALSTKEVVEVVVVRLQRFLPTLPQLRNVYGQ